jgi:hypothetical protein
VNSRRENWELPEVLSQRGTRKQEARRRSIMGRIALTWLARLAIIIFGEVSYPVPHPMGFEMAFVDGLRSIGGAPLGDLDTAPHSS